MRTRRNFHYIVGLTSCVSYANQVEVVRCLFCLVIKPLNNFSAYKILMKYKIKDVNRWRH